MTKFLRFWVLCFICLPAFADFKVLETVEDFDALVAESTVPVVVVFSAYWCGPCKNLKATFTKVAPDYSDANVVLANIDAYVNSELKKYLMGGYPTVRVFSKGEVIENSFVGSRPEAFVREFIDSVKTNS